MRFTTNCFHSYSQELPSRCRKEILQAVDKDGNGVVHGDALCIMLDNIGASNTVTREDVDNIIRELGDSSKATISREKVMQIM